MVTDDERRETRREAARYLMAYSKFALGAGTKWAELLERAIGTWVDGRKAYRPDADMLRLADLIDPTCKIFDSKWDNGQRAWGSFCSACGAHFAYTFSHDLRYCPRCGSRNVNAD